MTYIDLRGFDTQSAPMDAIAEIVDDTLNNYIDPKTAINYIYAVVCEWRH
jgi:hypothetical protein